MIEVTLQPTELIVGEETDLVVRLANTGPGTCTHIIFTLTLPGEIMLLRGRAKIEVEHLEPGQTATRALRVQPRSAARCRVTSANFAYRDRYGATCRRDSDFEAELVTTMPERRGTAAGAQPPAPKVAVTVDLVTAELPHGEWALLEGRITNSGDAELGNVELSISGPVVPDEWRQKARLGSMSPASSAPFQFFACASGPAGRMPVFLHLSFVDQAGRRTWPFTQGVQVTKENQPAPARKDPVVLFFAANPVDAEPLRTGKEFMVIVKALENGQGEAKVKIRPWLAARAKDISRELVWVKPWIVHFAGHGGGPDGSFIAETEDGYAHPIPPGGLVKLFKTAAENVECVIINACSTMGLAQALSQHVDYVIAMSQPINDWAAIEFSRAFYQALAANYSIRSAFNLGVAELEMLSDGAAYEIPQLLGPPA